MPRGLIVLCSTVTECDTYRFFGVRLVMPQHSCFHGKSAVHQGMGNPHQL